MKKMLDLIQRAPKRSAAIMTAIFAAVILPATLMAWGPTRPTFNAANPATFITFNSITDNPNVGDERNFVRIKDASNTSLGGWTDNLNVQPGKEYLVQLYVHNNAASNLNMVAENVNVMATVPNTTGKQITVEGFVNSSNAAPKQIWDQAIFSSNTDFNLTYVPGSAKLYNKVFTNGTTLSDSIVTSAGAPVGYDKLDGKLPGCFNYSGYVNFKVKVGAQQTADFDMTKQVRKSGETNWQKSVATKPGDTVDFLLSYKNTGEARQNNVVFTDNLPAGLTYINGSTVLRNGTNPDGLKISDKLTTQTGVNVGDYNSAAAAYVKFSAKVNDDPNLRCGTKTMTNTARAVVDNHYKEDSANVSITKPCAPGETPVVELPTTGIDGGAALAGIGLLTAGIAYALRSTRVRNLLRG